DYYCAIWHNSAYIF
nr:immunoglobulin light chain junction region [Macaca mulatta]MOW17640.1 immunoglobulin light chain junction region [Macaca mulatta]MOX77614.1 immunoglobulin light chain junction region [Macaca mulatta]MOX77706.1 immunoglobulin light chain junction region [Macaca mulatta]MOX77817.1 immunoglobulin light chain junction region [Macaca mulatta]